MQRKILNSTFHIPRWRRYWQTWQTIWQQYHRYHRINDLEQLTEWAEKRRYGVQHYYKRLMVDESGRQFRTRVNMPKLDWIACMLYELSWILFPKQSSFSKGHARKYSREYLLNTY